MKLKPVTGLYFTNLSIGFKNGRKFRQLGGLLNASAKQGELIALIGPNGVGKSTFIRTLANLQPPISGQILIDGYDLMNLSRNQLAKKVSIVTTELYRTSKLKVADLVALGRFPYSNWIIGTSDEDIKIIEDSLNHVNMLGLANRDIVELSDGEYQRAMIARAIAQDTPVLMLDEPTAFLDLANKYAIATLLWNLTRIKNKAILFSTHDINIAMHYADLFWVLTEEGLKSGTPEDLLLDGTLENLFKNQNVYFDSETVQFRIKRPQAAPIQLYGTGFEYQITKMAVERLGFEVSCNNSPELSVKVIRTVEAVKWEVTYLNSITGYETIYDLQLALKKLN